MFAARTLNHRRYLTHKYITNRIVRQSTTLNQIQPVTQDDEKYEKQLKTFETITNVTKRIRTKKPNRPPFAKNLFLGKFDNEILSYPQLEKEDVDLLQKDTNQLSQVLQQNHLINCTSLGDKNFRQNLSDYKAIALQASQLLDARLCNVTESFKFLETFCEHNLAQSLVINEQLGVQTLVTFADDFIKKKYLHPIIKGESLAAFCLNETDCLDIASFKTNATLSPDGKHWVSAIKFL